MGCGSSTYTDDDDEVDNSFKGYYASAKEIFNSHISNESSSGFSSICISPVRRSRYNTVQPKAKIQNFSPSKKRDSSVFKVLPVYGDFDDAEKVEKQQENRSFGYYSGSLSAESIVSLSSQSCLRKTQVHPETIPVAVTPTPNHLEMEMYMMSKMYGFMPKTSSPIFQRRDVSFKAIGAASSLSYSYQKWANYLESTPTHVLHNVTGVPEAIAGQFSPLDFPAFTDLEEMESAAKRFKSHIYLNSELEEDVIFYQKQISKPAYLVSTMTTDL